MAKFALCLVATNVPAAVSEIRNAGKSGLVTDPKAVAELLVKPTFMVDRATCETDATVLQLIPYIVLRNSKGEVFSYSRGGASEEARLKSKMSVGLGGHVDSPTPIGSSLEEHLRNEAVRELVEEAGIVVNPADLKIRGLLVDATTPVDIVHLGILCSYRMNQDQDIIAEAGVIEKGGFVSAETLLMPEILERMENWSKIVINPS